MPKIVDHDLRRTEISAAALRVIARGGIRGADLRSVAAEAECSTGVINHYFEDKRALLGGALRYATQSVGARMRKIMSDHDVDGRVFALLEAGMPLDEETSATCRIFYHFASEELSDASSRARLGEYYGMWRVVVSFAIIEEQKAGRFTDVDAEQLAEILVGIAQGLGVQGIFDPRQMTPTVLRERMSQAIARWRDSKIAVLT